MVDRAAFLSRCLPREAAAQIGQNIARLGSDIKYGIQALGDAVQTRAAAVTGSTGNGDRQRSRSRISDVRMFLGCSEQQQVCQSWLPSFQCARVCARLLFSLRNARLGSSWVCVCGSCCVSCVASVLPMCLLVCDTCRVGCLGVLCFRVEARPGPRTRSSPPSPTPPWRRRSRRRLIR